MSDGLPSSLPRPPGELEELERVWRLPRGWRQVTAVNNTYIGLLYIGTAMLFLVLAGILGLLMRAQLAVPNNTLLAPDTYNQVFTMHGTVMMFLFAVPIVEAIAVYLLPNMLGARDLPFPRLSAYAFWAYAFGGLAFFCSLFFGLAPEGGWFMYPPLTGPEHSPGVNADFWLLGIGFIEISAIAGAIELIIGILMTRPPGMTLGRMPVYAWAMLVVGLMIVFAFPAVIACTALLEMERAFDWPFFDAARGGDPLLWQHLFWFFGHPDVYIIFLPAAGLVSMMLPTMAGTPLVGHRAVIAALVATGFFSFALWVHHMFTAGLGTLSMSFVSAASMAVSIPAGIQVFAWIATLWRGRVRWTVATLFLIGFLVTFTMGGLTGVMVAALPFDWQAHDTYFVVAHFHYVLIGGMVMPVFAALYYWMPLVKGRALSERVGRWVFAGVFGGFHLTFFPMHLAGLAGMPRRVYTYDAGLGLEWPNLVASAGSVLIALGVAALVVDVVRTQRRPTREPHNPWNAPTLEWLPSGNYGMRSIPQVDGRDPLWQRPSMGEEVAAGRHWLPGTSTGSRETIVTTAWRGDPHHLIVLPGPSWLPIGGALGTAAFFLLLTVKLVWPAFVFGVAAVACVVAWLWQTDRLPRRDGAPATEARVGDRVTLPVGAALGMSHSWWATVVLLVVDAIVLASMAFGHVHLSMLLDVCPPPGAALPSPLETAAACAGFAASGLLLWPAARRVRSRPLAGGAQLAVAAAAAIATAAFVVLLRAHAGLAPSAHGWGATIASLLSYQGLHVVLIVVTAAYLVARIGAGLVTPRQRATFDNVALLWWGGCAQGVVVALLPHVVAAAMR